jgi:hypothetical protein
MSHIAKKDGAVTPSNSHERFCSTPSTTHHNQICSNYTLFELSVGIFTKETEITPPRWAEMGTEVVVAY